MVLINPRSGTRQSFDSLRRAFDAHWDTPANELFYQVCQNVADGVEKARRAVDRGVDAILVVGGDGTLSTIGRVLIGTPVALGCIPVGSGNGLARHFGIPLRPAQAIRALHNADTERIDVGVVNGMPFFVTCSAAWDASIVSTFEKFPFRGILPYVFAGVQQYFEYKPQPMRVVLDGADTLELADPLVCTLANLTQYGGGAIIAPQARHDDGHLELVVVLKQDLPRLLGRLGALFDGTLSQLPEVLSRRFRTLTIRRRHAGPIQVDGEVVDAPADLEVSVSRDGLRILVPRDADRERHAR